jgi:serine/threonine protein kinase
MPEFGIKWPLGLGRKDLVGAGITAIVVRLDAVVKFFQPTELQFLERETTVYQRLGHDHSGIIKYFGVLGNGIILQFAEQTSIRQYVARQGQISLPLRLRWVEQLFDTVRYVHSKNVLHGDISCNNIFLDNNLDVKLGDFSGSAIDDLPPLSCYETSHELPDADISAQTELFALGSTIYEIMTGSAPYKDLSDDQVLAAFSDGRYPDLQNVSTFRNTIRKCWTQEYTTVEEALRDVKLEGMLDYLAKLQMADDVYSNNYEAFTDTPFSRSSQPPNVSFPSNCCFPSSVCTLVAALEITSTMNVSRVRS